jgi:hypothetical protein
VTPCIATLLWPPNIRRSCTRPLPTMDEELEILVHISAPATRQNDDLYRSLADAYIRFEPGGASLDKPPHVEHGKSRIISNVTTSKDSYGSFPSHMDSGNHSSSQGQADAQTTSSLDEESQLPTSRLDQLERIQARWKQTTSRPSLASVHCPSTAREDNTFVDESQFAYQVMESQILDNVSMTSEDTSDDEAAVERIPLTESAGNSQKPQSAIESKTPFSSKTCEVLRAPTLQATPSLEVYPPPPQDSCDIEGGQSKPI